MSTSTFPIWLPAGIARKAVLPAVPSPRHLAPEPEPVETLPAGVAVDLAPGRHAEPEWARDLFDPARDGDLLDWLGFTAPTG
jgi:hypothetical protein